MGQCASSNSTKAQQAPGKHASHFAVIRDRFESIEEVQDGLRKAGLETSEVIVAIDLTKSNEWSGKQSFSGECLHSTSRGMNPYKSVISIMCQTLAPFDDDNLIPCFGFGDSASRDHSLTSFDPQCKPLHTFSSLLAAYDNVISKISLSGPTSFAPAIWKAIEIVEQSGGRYHILIIVADGQVSGGSCMRETVEAICEASNYPLSIIMVGVGDGPWDDMEAFDDGLPQRTFDSFQYVNFTKLAERAASRGYTADKWHADFALNALMEVPDQYAFIQRHGMLGTRQKRPIRPISVLPVQAVAGEAPRPSWPGASASLYNAQGAVATGVPLQSQVSSTFKI